MKAASLILALFVMLLLANCAPKKTPLPTDNIDELVGTWVNTEYDQARHGDKYGKTIWKADGIASFYRKSTYDRSYVDPKWIVKEKWKEGDEAIFYKIYLEGEHLGKMPNFHLIKLSTDRSYYEQQWNEKFPSEIDAYNPVYRIYYRQK